MAMVSVYKWKPGVRCGLDPQLAGSTLEDIIRRHGSLTPEVVVDESRPQNAPLHSYFDWDDQAAAESWRREQAKYLIRHIIVETSDSPQPTCVRAFVSIRGEEESGAQPVLSRPVYVRTVDALANPDLRRQVLKCALNDLAAWQRRYQDLEELARIFDSASLVRQELQPLVA